jgi:two-component system chemotaxis response regulator CheY
MRTPVTRALIVDDATTIRAYLHGILEDAGFEVEEAMNGLEGLEKALGAAEPPDLLVVDVNMPIMDGYAFLRAIRAEPALSDIPAIMLTTERQTQDVDRAFEAGANLFLTKPVRPDVMARFARMMTGSRQETAS